MTEQESSMWQGRPSQWLNFWHYTAGLLACAAIITSGLFFPPAFAALALPVPFIAWKFLVIRTQNYDLTTERLKITRGVINQHIDEIELYRIKDSQLVRTWWMRLTGLAAVTLQTSDRSMPTLLIPAIRDGASMRELLRKQVELQRDKKRVREMDFDESDAGPGE